MRLNVKRFDLEQIETARRMHEAGASAAEIGRAIHQVGEMSTPQAHRSRGRRILVALASENLVDAPQGARVSEKPPVSKARNNGAVGNSTEGTQGARATESRTQTGDTLAVSIEECTEEVRSLEDLLRVCRVNQDEWQVDRWTCNKWEMGYKDASKEAKSIPLFQVKAWFKRKKEEYDARLALVLAVDAVKAHAPYYPPLSRVRSGGDGLLFELSLPDVHVGKLAWGAECGEDYDLKIACNVFMDAFTALAEDARCRDIERIVFPIGNDLLNCDSPSGNTTAGTPQSNDGRYQKVYQTTLALLVGAIDRLREIAPVDVLTVPGNHDTLSVWTLGETIKAWYRSADDVAVDNSPMLRKYYRYGRSLLLFTHGDREKITSLPLIMAQERRQDWAETIWREAHIGHRHKSASVVMAAEELAGIRIRTLPSLCATDAWHHQQGYVSNVRSAESYFWSRERGLAGTGVYNVPVGGLALPGGG
jgi:hypothetical protein